MFRKYRKIMTVSLQNFMEYKFHFITSIICSFIPFGVNSLIWLAIGNYSKEGYGYTIREMISYYFIIMIVTTIIKCEITWQICDEIKNGGLSKYLMKPCSYLSYHFFCDLPKRLAFIVCGFFPILVLYLCIQDWLAISLSVETAVLFVLSMFIGYIINFFIYYILGILSFYFSEVNGIVGAYTVVVSILSGKVFSLSLLPGGIRELLMVTPFQYVGYVPVTVMQNRYSNTELLQVLGIGIVWIIVLYGISKLIWHNGLNKYSAYGG